MSTPRKRPDISGPKSRIRLLLRGAGVGRRPRSLLSPSPSLSTRSLYNVPRALKFGAGVLHFDPGSFHPHSQKIALVRQQPWKVDKSHLSSYRIRHGCSWATISLAGPKSRHVMLRYAVFACDLESDEGSGLRAQLTQSWGVWVTHSPRTDLTPCETCLRGWGRGQRREGAFRTTQASLCEDA